MYVCVIDGSVVSDILNNLRSLVHLTAKYNPCITSTVANVKVVIGKL